jgi:hypothetical protein
MLTINCNNCGFPIPVEYNPLEISKEKSNKKIIRVDYLPSGKCDKSIYLKCPNNHELKAFCEIIKK